ncbi:putative magnesium transporter NIPA7 [Colletotrichum sp. SAR 10_96]|nr:putative magnesium transporter NIPA7 [Colletotrichum sp. SAR 10_96]
MVPSVVIAADPAARPGHGDGDGGKDLQNWSSLIGIITAIVGNILIALALNVQRYAHIRLHRERIQVRRRAKEALKHASGGPPSVYGTVNIDDSDRSRLDGHQENGHNDASESEPLTRSFRSEESTGSDYSGDDEKAPSTYLKSPYWWMGQILITLGELGNFLAYGFAPASIVSPLGVVALISNCIIAPILFKEKFRQRDFWGVVIAVAGVVVVVLSAKQEETKLDPHDVWDAITTLEFEIYLAVTVSLIIVLMWASPRYGHRTILIDLGLVGLFGGFTALSTKGVSSMLSSTLLGAFKTPVTYALLFTLLFTAVMQVRYVNKALQRFSSTQVIPVQFVLFTLCVIVGSAVLYRDFERTSAEQAVKFVGGCFFTFSGVVLITSGRVEEDIEDAVINLNPITEITTLLKNLCRVSRREWLQAVQHAA